MRVDPAFLWTSAQGYAGLSTTAGFCVLDHELRPLRCDLPDRSEPLERLRAAREERLGAITLEWTGPQDRRYLAGTWQIFLDAAFNSPAWTVIVAENHAEFFAPLNSFRAAFLPVVVFALAVVALLSNVQIRRSLEPLEALSGATRRIADGDLGARVRVDSGDEFERLAGSFNDMARGLETQFRASRRSTRSTAPSSRSCRASGSWGPWSTASAGSCRPTTWRS